MDDYMFNSVVEECSSVTETTSYLEIFHYSDPAYNSNEEHPLPMHEFDDFVHRRGRFEPPRLEQGVKLLHGLRLVLQQKAEDPETFAPGVISFTPQQYEAMVRGMRLPFRAIESTAVVGLFFWSAMDQDDADPHMHVIFRKSDVRKKGRTRGWELMLSYSFRTGITSGFAKGTESSDMVEAVRHARHCAAQTGHPFLLPVIILSHSLNPKKGDQKQRDARDWLRRLEHAVTMRDGVQGNEVHAHTLDFDQLNRDLVECHSQVLWMRPQAYLEIIHTFNDGLAAFRNLHFALIPIERGGGPYGELDRLHRNMLGRLDFYRAKLRGINNYASTTLERLQLQRASLSNALAQKESRLSLEIAGQQRRLAHSAKRDSHGMKTLSLFGAIFLPATLVSSIFSTTFFDFQATERSQPVVAASVWVYFAISVPLTLVVVLSWMLWDRRRTRSYAEEDAELEAGIEEMENKIMATTQLRSLTKVRTAFPLMSELLLR
ncbi:hypothetical protein MAPG_08437 [Magnaporthiopsis poae ATCC 64411]|uniref:CorA family metal ion transporter n=1 Tax=Magnaporthiopsis poae (strain ATCC 64411 / 73-15) TaxID=644358 RepID=A0A0C4E7C5_MAGP6|nr:hypothetical protein MAPG_08437 [Magnaporthiopsis poae ATCC 64411]